ncbi:hypothetical protein GYH30_038319 [Glycine max]|nr:hypothetical protein GYH30_038319 [Glycine max]
MVPKRHWERMRKQCLDEAVGSTPKTAQCLVATCPSNSNIQTQRVSFQAIGKNPFWVYDGEALRLFRKFDMGHLQLGNRFCFSPNTPLWFTLNNIQPQPQLNLD